MTAVNIFGSGIGGGGRSGLTYAKASKVFVNRAGDSMFGALIVPDPKENKEAVNKDYLDSEKQKIIENVQSENKKSFYFSKLMLDSLVRLCHSIADDWGYKNH